MFFLEHIANNKGEVCIAVAVVCTGEPIGIIIEIQSNINQ